MVGRKSKGPARVASCFILVGYRPMTRLVFADLSERPLDEVIWGSTRSKTVEDCAVCVGCARSIGIKVYVCVVRDCKLLSDSLNGLGC